jgi:hypothetical protein
LGMKRGIWMVAVLTAAMTAMAQQQTQPQTNAVLQVPVSATVQKPTANKKVEIFTPLSKKIPSPQTDKIEHVDGMSSQPWFRMVGPEPGWSAFPDPERQDATLNVAWIGAPPPPWR